MTALRHLATGLLLLAALFGGPARAADADHWQRSYDLEVLGRFDDALAELDRVRGDTAATYLHAARRAWLLYLTGRYKAASAAYDEAARRAPKALEPLLGRMLAEMAQRRWLDALATGEAVLKRDPGSWTVKRRLGLVFYHLGRYTDAETVYREVLQAFPSDLELHAGLGWTLLKLARNKEAAQAFLFVRSVAPRNQSALDGLKALGTTGQ